MIAGSVKLDHVQRGLDEMNRRGLRPSIVLAGLRKPARKDQSQHARKKEGPDGAWPKRARATAYGRGAKRKRLRRRRLLGRLPSALNMKVTRSSLTVQSKVPWSGVHQHGGRAGNGARIPQRHFLWFSDEILDLAAERLQDHVKGGW